LWICKVGSLADLYFDDAVLVVTGNETSTARGTCEEWVSEACPRSN
jgi:hypothetical protein